MIYLIFFCFAIFHTISSLSEIPRYKCEIYGKKRCNLHISNVTMSNKHFTVIQPKSISEIISFKFGVSRIEVLTNDVCNALPYVSEFIAEIVKLTVIEENAFEKCSNLQYIDLSNNNLQALPSQLFVNNLKLRNVYLNNNNLNEIDKNLFQNNTLLQNIKLNANRLSEFSFGSKVPILKNLILIDLRYNELKTLNFDELLSKCPNKSLDININDNHYLKKQKQIFYLTRNGYLNLNHTVTEKTTTEIYYNSGLNQIFENSILNILKTFENLNVNKESLPIIDSKMIPKKRIIPSITTQNRFEKGTTAVSRRNPIVVLHTTQINDYSKISNHKNKTKIELTTKNILETLPENFTSTKNISDEETTQSNSKHEDSNNYYFFIIGVIVGGLITIAIYKYGAFLIKKLCFQTKEEVAEEANYTPEYSDSMAENDYGADYYYGYLEGLTETPNDYESQSININEYDHLDFSQKNQIDDARI